MSTLMWLLAAAGAFAFAIAALVWSITELGGSKRTQERRRAELVQSLDGRPEVRIRVYGTGMTPAQTVWLAEQYGYRVFEWPQSRGIDVYVTMRRVAPPAVGPFPTPPRPLQPTEPGAPAPPHPAAMAPLPHPTPADQQRIAHDLHNAQLGGDHLLRAFALCAIGVICLITAMTRYTDGQSYAVATALGAAFVVAGVTVFAWGRRARRKLNRPDDTAHRS
ncbi:hypothetical protein RCO28_38795 [Streptomyces sp. LHD-70]|uniref:hypothetical protein n=1 Tax=Streptomyces sp. LHD-70 TaxID=3072140 RepID=UPI00280D0394|nr:hypothetical protein [Streptomyces sp. LHD-70]MDQ8708364.1 hypothetical protein [Streptomyces sp. LHD-70]